MAKVVTRKTNVSEGAPGRTSTAQVYSSEMQAEGHDTLAYLIYFFFGVVEVLLAFRFVLKIAGANPVSGFVRFIYGITQLLVWPFEGIFRRAAAPGFEVTSIFEPSTLVAIVVYAVLAWGILQLVAIMAGKTVDE
jgi:hypothetical protein